MIEDSRSQSGHTLSNRAHALLFEAVAMVDIEEVEQIAAELDEEIELVLESAQEQEIEERYAELDALAQASASPARNRRWRQLARQLRILQQAEADRMEAYFEANSPLPPGSVDDAIRHADKLLAVHANATPSNGTRRKAT